MVLEVLPQAANVTGFFVFIATVIFSSRLYSRTKDYSLLFLILSFYSFAALQFVQIISPGSNVFSAAFLLIGGIFSCAYFLVLSKRKTKPVEGEKVSDMFKSAGDEFRQLVGVDQTTRESIISLAMMHVMKDHEQKLEKIFALMIVILVALTSAFFWTFFIK